MNQRYHHKATSPELANAAMFYGLYSAVARELGVSPQAVRQVALGISTSKKIRAAIEQEVKARKGRMRGRAA